MTKNATEALRLSLGWPTPNHMRRAAQALDLLTSAQYGDVLRWVADMCDADPEPDSLLLSAFASEREALIAIAKVSLRLRKGQATRHELVAVASVASRLIPTRHCDECLTEYLHHDKRQSRFCSARCRYRFNQRAYRQRQREAAE